MSNLSLRLPDSLHRKIRQLAQQDDISINQFIATAVAEKAAALLTVEYLAERGRRADPQLVDRILSRVPDVPPDPGDELPLRRQPNPHLQSSKARRRPGKKPTKRARLRG
jgi:predicted transcriptional regulator